MALLTPFDVMKTYEKNMKFHQVTQGMGVGEMKASNKTQKFNNRIT